MMLEPRCVAFARVLAAAGCVALLGACVGKVGSDADLPEGTPETQPRSDLPARTTGVAPPSPAACRAPGQRFWRLTPTQIARSLEAVARGAGEGVADRLRPLAPETRLFSNEADPLGGSANALSELFTVASEAADRALRQPEQLHACLRTELASDTCIRSFVTEVGARAFRRPLAADETTDYLAFFAKDAQAFGRQTAVRQVLRRMLVSPDFLFRSEIGRQAGGTLRLTPHETASALSYLLLDAPPDRPLVEAATAGALDETAEIARQARRLLATADTSPGLARLVTEYLGTDRVVARAPDMPNRAAVVAAMAEEPWRFAQRVLWSEDRRLQTLLGGGFAMVDGALAPHYGLTTKPTTWTKVTIPDRPGGLLTTAAALTVHRGPTARGIFVRERLLCQDAPPAPGDTETDIDKQRALFEKQTQRKLTEREVRDLHMANPACSGCHRLIDPLGFPFDGFDAAGRRRDKVDGQPVVTAGEIVGTAHTDGKVADAREMVQRLAASADVRACFASHVFQYAHGRSAVEADGCALADLERKFEAGGDVLSLVTDIVSHPSFVTRTPGRDN